MPDKPHSINRLVLHNFKSVTEQTYDFKGFDLLIGANNAGKSTVLQALAVWQFCVSIFRETSRNSGDTGVTVTLDNFTALPVPEFDLLWRNRATLVVHRDSSGKNLPQENVPILINVEWGAGESFGVELRYRSPQTISAAPVGVEGERGWTRFRRLDQAGELPVIAFVPPFSGLEPREERRDEPVIRFSVGKAQPGSVLRNLLLKVVTEDESEGTDHWTEIHDVVENWFSLDLERPEYRRNIDRYIKVNYKRDARKTSKSYDIISGGSGFHQTLTLLAFLYGYNPNVILLDEPDAHLHVSLQANIIDYFKRKFADSGTQFIVATHAEEFIRGVDSVKIRMLLNRNPSLEKQEGGHLVSLLSGRPVELDSASAISGTIEAMSSVANMDVAFLRSRSAPVVLYLEGEDDERILRAWSAVCGVQDIINDVLFKVMGGGTKKEMEQQANRHFEGLQQIVPGVQRLMLLDYDSNDKAFHPAEDNPRLYEWKRTNIENYLIVEDAWLRTVEQNGDAYRQVVEGFFVNQGLRLPPNQNWRTTRIAIFTQTNGKRLLFADHDSLYHQLERLTPQPNTARADIAINMTADQIHNDVHDFFAKLRAAVAAAHEEYSKAFPTLVENGNHEGNGNGATNGSGTSGYQTTASQRSSRTGIKPQAVIIGGVRYEANSWRAVAKQLVEYVIDKQPAQFEQLAANFPNWLRHDKADLREAYPLINGWFMEVNLDRGQIRKYYTRFMREAGIADEQWSVEERPED